MNKTKYPSKSYLKECFKYNDKTGKLYWKKRPRNHFKRERDCNAWNGHHSKKEAGNITQGYLRVTINYKVFFVHRICFILSYGYSPKQRIDHINRNSLDNSTKNLRKISASGNAINRKVRLNSSSGITGVSWAKKSNKWLVQIKVNGKIKHIGLYKKLTKAAYHRYKAEIEYNYFDYNNTSPAHLYLKEKGLSI